MNTMVIESKQSQETGVGLEPSDGFAITPQIEEIVESASHIFRQVTPSTFQVLPEQAKRHWPSM